MKTQKDIVSTPPLRGGRVGPLLFNAARIIAAIIMLQTLFFKFSGAEESIYIFTKAGIEPWGRIGTGILELVASILLFVPHTKWMGAILGMGLMAGAIVAHLTILGIEVMNDKGYLFFLALIVFICCSTVAAMERKNIPAVKLLFN